MIEWIIDNKNWIFSGIGVFVMTIVVNSFLRRKKEKDKIQLKDMDRTKGKIKNRKNQDIHIENIKDSDLDIQ